MASFSAHVMSANLVNYTTTKVDQLIVGTFLGVEALGYYYVAQRLIETVGAVCYEPFRLIAMPVLSRFQFDRERFDRIYRSLVWTSTAAWLPALGGLALLADTFIPLLFGHKWDTAIGLFQVMALVSITAAIPVHTNRALLSAGQANEFRNLSLLQLAITVVLFALAARFGMLAVGAAYAAVPLALTPFHLRALGRIGISSGWLVLRCLLILVAGLAMAGFVVSTWGAQLPGPGWFRVAFEVLGGALTYVTVLSVIARRETVEVVDLIRGMLPGFGCAQFTARKTPHIVGCGHIRARIRTWPSRSSRS
jgi:PST family polysaccharide transporter